MNLAIYVKIKNIRENIDKIGLTNEIRKGIIIVIVLLSICMAYTIFGFIIVSNNGDSNDNKKIELKEEIRELEEEIKELKKKKNDANNQKKIELKEEIRELEEEIKELKKKKNEINENGTLTLNSERRVINNNNSENKKIIELMNEIMEIKSCNPYLLKKNENLLSIIFISNDQTIKYSVVCKNTDKFVTAEQSLYERFNNYREGQNMFLFNGESLNRNKTIDELKIKNGDVITIAPFED
jgi:TolA-binding protein